MAKPIPEKPITYPTTGGSYVRQSDGGFNQVAATTPAQPDGKAEETPVPPPATTTKE